MKKSVKTIIALVAVVALVASLSIAFAACNEESNPNPLLDATEFSAFANQIGAYEAGSSGQEFYKNFKTAGALTPKEVTSQMDALVAVNGGSAQFAIVDSILASQNCGQGNFSNLKVVAGIKGDPEKYAIGFRKGDPLRDEVNGAMKKLLNTKTKEIAAKYSLSSVLVDSYEDQTEQKTAEPTTKSDPIKIGYTISKPMNYLDDNSKLVGFDTEFATAVFAELGYDVQFIEIEWGNKYIDLESNRIDCIWNGFTSNGSDDGKARSEYVDFSYTYMNNYQAVVVKGTI